MSPESHEEAVIDAETVIPQDVTVELAEPMQEVELEEGAVRAKFVITKLSGAQKERVEKLVISHQGHRRSGEQLGFTEQGSEMHVRHSGVNYHSLQHVIAKMTALAKDQKLEMKLVFDGE